MESGTSSPQQAASTGRLQGRVIFLESEVQSAQRKIQDLQAGRDTDGADLRALRKECDSLKEHNHHLSLERARNLSRISELELTLKQEQESAQASKEDLESRVARTFAELSGRIVELEGQLQECGNELSATREKLKRSVGEISQMQHSTKQKAATDAMELRLIKQHFDVGMGAYEASHSQLDNVLDEMSSRTGELQQLVARPAEAHLEFILERAVRLSELLATQASVGFSRHAAPTNFPHSAYPEAVAADIATINTGASAPSLLERIANSDVVPDLSGSPSPPPVEAKQLVSPPQQLAASALNAAPLLPAGLQHETRTPPQHAHSHPERSPAVIAGAPSAGSTEEPWGRLVALRSRVGKIIESKSPNAAASQSQYQQPQQQQGDTDLSSPLPLHVSLSRMRGAQGAGTSAGARQHARSPTRLPAASLR